MGYALQLDCPYSKAEGYHGGDVMTSSNYDASSMLLVMIHGNIDFICFQSLSKTISPLCSGCPTVSSRFYILFFSFCMHVSLDFLALLFVIESQESMLEDFFLPETMKATAGIINIGI